MKKILVTFVILLALSSLAFSQEDTFASFLTSPDFNFLGAGARARGMGGAFIGLADDATAVSWNPAGLVRLEKPEASIVGFYEGYSIATDIEDFDADAYKYSFFNLNFMSAAMPLSIGEKNLVAAVAFQRIMNLYSKYDDEDYSMERTGGVNAISPALGVQLTPNISIGATANIYMGSTNYKAEDKSGFVNSNEAEYKYSGTNFNIGGLFTFDKFSLGAVFKTPFELNEKEDEFDYDVSYTMPSTIGLGLKFSPTEKLTLGADYEMRKFSETKMKYNKDAAFYFEGEEVDLEWQDINQFRLGAEYLLMSGTSILPLRIGLASSPTIYKDANDDQITGATLTGGVGLIMGNINLDLAIEYTTYAMEFDMITDKYELNRNYLRFLVSGVFHLGK
ncbi:hypothetical protein JW964_20815 [candidate division KSB1 bacterium]|nr:hypothetical protein [candidate division KSB1 bacterium]